MRDIHGDDDDDDKLIHKQIIVEEYEAIWANQKLYFFIIIL